MIIKYCEIYLTLKNNTNQNIGPLCYMRKVIKNKKILTFYACLVIVSSLLLGNMTQINAVSEYIHEYNGFNPIFVGIILTLITAFLICQKGDKIAGMLTYIVPIMGTLYILCGTIIIFRHVDTLPNCFAAIFKGAFRPEATAGGLFGSGIMLAARKGCMNGLFSHEAGVGSSAFAHAQAKNVKPEIEGLWGIIEVFIDSILISSITAFVLLSNGLDKKGAPSIISAFTNTFGHIGAIFFIISVFLFAVTAMMSWSYYGRCGLGYITSKYMKAYIIIFLICTFIATQINTEPIWELSETFN